MKRNFTQEDIINYIYGETSSEEANAIKEELSINEELNDYYQETLKVLNVLDSAFVEPSETTISILMENSKSSSSLETH